MNTFLPSNDYQQIARLLDLARLNRQIVECIWVGKVLFSYKLLRNTFQTVPQGIIWPQVIKLWISSNVVVSYKTINESFYYEGTGLTPPNKKYQNVSDGDGEVLIPELMSYYNTLCNEWLKHRGKPHGVTKKFNWERIGGFDREPFTLEWPKEVYESHRSHLLEKEYTYYLSKFAQEQLYHNGVGMKYFWQGPEIK